MASETLNEVASLNVPDTNYVIPATSCDETPVMRDRDAKHGRLCASGLENLVVAFFQIPDTYRAIGRTGDNGSTILRVAQRVDATSMAFKEELKALVLDVPDLCSLKYKDDCRPQ